MKAELDAVPSPGHAGAVELLAGRLCLDFANSVEPRVTASLEGPPREYLTDYSELIAWSEHAGLLGAHRAQRLLERAALRPAAARVVLEQAITLREAIYRVFYAVATQADPTPDDLAVISVQHGQALDNAVLARAATGRFELVWAGDADDLSRPLWPIVGSAVELLLDGDPARVKDCPTGGAGCGWLFYDTSKNNSRRWCSMRSCGGPEKERRRAERRRGG